MSRITTRFCAKTASCNLQIQSPNTSSSDTNVYLNRDRIKNRWWNPKMTSTVLQNRFNDFYVLLMKNFEDDLFFIGISVYAIWAIYFISISQQINDFKSWLPYALWSLMLVFVFAVIYFIKRKWSKRRTVHWIVTWTFVTSYLLTAFISVSLVDSTLTTTGSFVFLSQLILLIYLLVSYKPLFSLIFGSFLSIIYEILFHTFHTNFSPTTTQVIYRILFHVIVHIIGISLMLRISSLNYSIFWEICHVIQTSEAREREISFKDLMIKSVMPLSIADEIFNCDKNTPVANAFNTGEEVNRLFRDFIMQKMDQVSILYADIVGFTQMSANKTAAELVGLLNDLFGRFDHLCEVTGCEKISTLGDCYYCVAGCPQPRPDHAICCVEMGLGMIDAIKQFCHHNNINVDMRVGVHTGRVMCGIIGTRRYKFDVFSNDVSLANGMEQYGLPGRIHITQSTLNCLQNQYEVEDSCLESRSESFKSKAGKTYFIVARKTSLSQKAFPMTSPPDANGSSGHVTWQPATENKELESLLRSGDQQLDKEVKNEASKPKQDQLMEYFGQFESPMTQSGQQIKAQDDQEEKLFRSFVGNPLFQQSFESSKIDHLRMKFNDEDLEKQFQAQNNVISDDVTDFVRINRFHQVQDVVTSLVVNILLFIASLLSLQNEENDKNDWIAAFLICIIFLILSTAIFLFLYCFKNPPKILLNIWNPIIRCMITAFFFISPLIHVITYVIMTTTAPLCSNYVTILILILLSSLIFTSFNFWIRVVIEVVVMAVGLLIAYLYRPNSFCSAASSGAFELIISMMMTSLFVVAISRRLALKELLWFWNAESAERNEVNMKTEKRRVEALLENFIPPHVRDHMKDQNVYSKTHKNVGVIFGSIVNFNELYDEDFEGGIEFIRILSELISDVDDLLEQKKFEDIVKIKTIGTTMMLASGLNICDEVNEKDTGRSHLCQLMNFCVEMQNAVDNFNKDLLNFQLVLRIGFNHGEVTAGVIGTTKRLYDIWGDTVNTASRMDSTGVPGRIQVSEESKKILENDYNFQHIGEKFVKGKGRMETYLLVRDDEESRVIIPNPRANYEPF